MECHIYKNTPDGDIQYHFDMPKDEMEDLKAEMREAIDAAKDLDNAVENVLSDLSVFGIVIE